MSYFGTALCSAARQPNLRRQPNAAVQNRTTTCVPCPIALTMNWALLSIVPLLVFVALTGLRKRVRRQTLRPVPIQSEPDDATSPVVPQEARESTSKVIPVEEDIQLAFDRLRGAMEGGDANLFAPLQVALVNLIRIGRIFEVSMNCGTYQFMTELPFRVGTPLFRGSSRSRLDIMLLRRSRAGRWRTPSPRPTRICKNFCT